MINGIQCRRKFLDQVLSSFRVKTLYFWLWNQKFLTSHSIWSQIWPLSFFCFAVHCKELTPASSFSLAMLPAGSSSSAPVGGPREGSCNWRKEGARVFLLTFWGYTMKKPTEYFHRVSMRIKWDKAWKCLYLVYKINTRGIELLLLLALLRWVGKSTVIN